LETGNPLNSQEQRHLSQVPTNIRMDRHPNLRCHCGELWRLEYCGLQNFYVIGDRKDRESINKTLRCW